MSQPRSTPFKMAFSIAAALFLGGCDGVQSYLAGRSDAAAPGSNASASSSSLVMTEIIAQGTLQPRGGVLAIMAAPGDRVAEVLVSPGQSVEAGKLLILLESFAARQLELKIAEMQIAEAEAKIAAQRSAAASKLKVAEIALRQAKMQLAQARDRSAAALAPGGSLDLLRQAAELGQRKLDQLRNASQNPSTTRLVSDNSLDEEQLKVAERQLQLSQAKTAAEQAIENGELAVQSAEQEIEAAQMEIDAALASSPIESLKEQTKLLDLKVQTSRLIAPMAGEILAVEAMVGQATGPMPLVQMANVGEMICVAEVNVADLPRIAAGQPAIIRSPGLAKPIAGVVERIQPMISPPALSNPFPMAPVDRHAAEVTIRIADSDAAAAADLIQLQVEVTIQTDRSKVAESSRNGSRQDFRPDGDPVGVQTALNRGRSSYD